MSLLLIAIITSVCGLIAAVLAEYLIMRLLPDNPTRRHVFSILFALIVAIVALALLNTPEKKVGTGIFIGNQTVRWYGDFPAKEGMLLQSLEVRTKKRKIVGNILPEKEIGYVLSNPPIIMQVTGIGTNNLVRINLESGKDWPEQNSYVQLIENVPTETSIPPTSALATATSTVAVSPILSITHTTTITLTATSTPPLMPSQTPTKIGTASVTPTRTATATFTRTAVPPTKSSKPSEPQPTATAATPPTRTPPPAVDAPQPTRTPPPP